MHLKILQENYATAVECKIGTQTLHICQFTFFLRLFFKTAYIWVWKSIATTLKIRPIAKSEFYTSSNVRLLCISGISVCRGVFQQRFLVFCICFYWNFISISNEVEARAVRVQIIVRLPASYLTPIPPTLNRLLKFKGVQKFDAIPHRSNSHFKTIESGGK